MDIQELHANAMNLADKADFLKMQGKETEACELYSKSLAAEREAAYEARNQHIGEPSEGVLFRSAATLAYGLKDYREAERLICMGLAGNPPHEIVKELRTLYDSVSFERDVMEMDSTAQEKEHEQVTITIPIRERNLLKVLVRKFGWACMF